MVQTPDINQFPVLKADALKFIMTFRGQVLLGFFD
jgi:hypothetical protein